MSEVKWIKIVTDIFDDEKVQLIESLPEADSIIVIWFKLLCLAGKNNNSGVFTLNDRIHYTDEMFSTIFRRHVNIVKLALTTFEKFGMIELINDVVTIPNWSKHQHLDQLEEKKKYQRNYMKKYREKQKQITDQSYSKSNCKTNSESNSKANVSSTDKDKEIDINKRKNIKKENGYFDQLDSSLHKLFEEYLDLRKQLKVKNTDRAVGLLINELKKYSLNEQKQMIENSIMHSWKSVYPLKKQPANNQQSKSQTPAVNAILDENWRMTDEEFEALNDANIRAAFGDEFAEKLKKDIDGFDQKGGAA
ncbi:phage replisome organizer N-terminal domain-containing protein [Thiotrichales bacterium 19X7-9]|nr:phage replisome organizer N-terminal domain-containing protein [Thiotrichales bacterium 19X7-9]